MTTIDKTGKIVSQVMKNYADRKETEIFKALAKQIAHGKIYEEMQKVFDEVDNTFGEYTRDKIVIYS